jgi:hypothetical protein
VFGLGAGVRELIEDGHVVLVQVQFSVGIELGAESVLQTALVGRHGAVRRDALKVLAEDGVPLGRVPGIHPKPVVLKSNS